MAQDCFSAFVARPLGVVDLLSRPTRKSQMLPRCDFSSPGVQWEALCWARMSWRPVDIVVTVAGGVMGTPGRPATERHPPPLLWLRQDSGIRFSQTLHSKPRRVRPAATSTTITTETIRARRRGETMSPEGSSNKNPRMSLRNGAAKLFRSFRLRWIFQLSWAS